MRGDARVGDAQSNDSKRSLSARSWFPVEHRVSGDGAQSPLYATRHAAQWYLN